MKNINIPEPCHENWADFTPTQKGAFCHSCKIDVVDFSNKSPEEVKSILKQNAGKHLCGRFKKSQLQELNDDFYAWENQSSKSFQSKFLYACLIVFGMSLFTSCNLNEQHILGEIAIIQNDHSDLGQSNMMSPAAINSVDKDTTKTPKPNKHIKGKIKYVPDEDIKTTCTTPDSLEEIEFIKGDVAYIPEEDVLGNVIVEDTSKNESIDTLYDDMMIDGEIAWTEEFEQYVEDTTTVDSTSTETENPSILEIDPAEEFISSLYPNPTSDVSKVVINVMHPSVFDIYLYAIDGKHVKSIFNGYLSTGKQEFIIDLSPYNAGSYLVIINSNQQKESLRIEKLD